MVGRSTYRFVEQASVADQMMKCRLSLNSHTKVLPRVWRAVEAGYDPAALERLGTLDSAAYYGRQALLDSLASGSIAGLRGS